MELAFQADYNLLQEQCPPKNYKAQNFDEVYRWTFEKIEDSRNFTSQYHKNPKRFQLKTDKEKCGALALSMFNNLEGARERFAEIAEDMGEKIYQVVGNKIAKGHISASCGLNGEIERHGHFNHHPAKNIPAQISFKISENLIA